MVDSGVDSDGCSDTAHEVLPIQVADNVSTAREPWPWTRTTTGHGSVTADGERFTGSVSYSYSFDDSIVCNVTVALAGISSSERCEGCEFAFDIDAEITEDYSASGCELPPGATFIPTEFVYNLKLAFADEYTVLAYYNGYYDWQVFQDVFLVGASIDLRPSGGDYFPGPYWYPIYYDGPYWDFGWAALEDAELDWGNVREGEYQGIAYYDRCLTAEWSEATQFYEGETFSGNLTCSATTLDGWTVDATCGDTLTVAIDTVDVETDFDPYFWVNGPDGCSVVRADDNYICTPAFEDVGEGATPLCPSAQFEVPTSGTYTIWVMSLGYWCNLGSDVQYTLTVGREP